MRILHARRKSILELRDLLEGPSKNRVSVWEIVPLRTAFAQQVQQSNIQAQLLAQWQHMVQQHQQQHQQREQATQQVAMQQATSHATVQGRAEEDQESAALSSMGPSDDILGYPLLEETGSLLMAAYTSGSSGYRSRSHSRPEHQEGIDEPGASGRQRSHEGSRLEFEEDESTESYEDTVGTLEAVPSGESIKDPSVRESKRKVVNELLARYTTLYD